MCLIQIFLFFLTKTEYCIDCKADDCFIQRLKGDGNPDDYYALFKRSL